MSVTLEQIAECYRETTRAAGTQPDLAITTLVIYEEIAALMGPRRFYLERVLIAGQSHAATLSVLDLSQNNPAYGPLPLVADPQCPPENLYWLNTRCMDDEMVARVLRLIGAVS
jgi:hypothetical protein